MFNKPWERYNAHLHFYGNICDNRLSPSEWDSGGYFDPEFVVDGRLLSYVQFEEIGGRLTGSVDATDRYAMREDDRTWYDRTYGDEGLRKKVRISRV